MRHIGIVACSAEGAALCYRQICHQSFRMLGENQHPRITLDAIPLASWMPAFTAGDYKGVAAIMLESAQVLAQAGADFAICPDNSAHLAWDQVMAATPIPWLHIAEVLAAEAQSRGYETIGVLGTEFTMNGHVYPDVLQRFGMKAVVPDADERAEVDRIIFDELLNGDLREESRQEYVEVIERLQRRGCDAVALACTEIPLLIGPGDSPLPTLDSTRLLAGAALRHAIE
jgi:aspartate racemase